MEFPTDVTTFGIDTNYMFGDTFLIAATYHNFHQTKVYLPPSADWYNFYTSERLIPTKNIRTVRMEPEEIGVYVKAGSIIARKYTRRLSALQTLQDNYMVDIYPKLEGDRSAKGMLYLDDGETFSSDHTIVDFNYANGKFTITNSHATYTKGQSFTIDEVNIFGVSLPPYKVLVSEGQLSDDCDST